VFRQCTLCGLALRESFRRQELTVLAVSEWTAVRSLEAQAADAIARRLRAMWAASQLRFEARIAFAVGAERIRTLVSDERLGREQLRGDWAEGLLALGWMLTRGRRMLPLFPPLFPVGTPERRSPRTPRETPRGGPPKM
jgi:hypothetical protein